MLHGKSFAVDLYAGLGGWTEGLLAEGWEIVIGFDIERHVYGDQKYPAQLVLQDVTTLHGSQFKDADLIVASSPCQAYSYRAMPWKRAKALPPPDNTLFEACFRIQREANAVADHYIPLVVENVCGAQKWVGRARWHFGSFYLWGDVPALMPIVTTRVRGEKFLARPSEPFRGGSWFDKTKFTNSEGERNLAIKNHGGSWFNIGSPGQTVTNQNPVHWLTAEGVKQHGSGREWFAGEGKISRISGSRSPARKAASAQIAKIPLVLASWIGKAWYPVDSAGREA